MSYVVSNACNKREFGRGLVKQIVMYLADKASDDGDGIWCSKYTIARETENSHSSVKRAIRELVKVGVLIEIGYRDCDRGQTIVYKICLDAVKQLPLLKKPREIRLETTGVSLNPVTNAPPTGVQLHPVPGSLSPPNHSGTVLEPPLSPTLISLEQATEDFWKAYPQDRRRRREICGAMIRRILTNGCRPEELISATKAYNNETANHTRSLVSFSDNWLKNRRWIVAVEESRRAMLGQQEVEKRTAEKVASWIRARDPVCARLVTAQIEDVFLRNLISEEEARWAKGKT